MWSGPPACHGGILAAVVELHARARWQGMMATVAGRRPMGTAIAVSRSWLSSVSRVNTYRGASNGAGHLFKRLIATFFLTRVLGQLTLFKRVIAQMRLLTFVLLAPAMFAAIVPTRLRCEYRDRPEGIDTLRPRLSWALLARPDTERDQRQTAYRVLVAMSPAILGGDRGDLWDSGKVASSRQSHIEYAGRELASGARCYWKVQVWDRDGRPSGWSEVAGWSMGLLEGGPQWRAKWIGDPRTVVAADADQRAAAAAHYGFRSAGAASTWVALDIGSIQTIDGIRLWPAQFYVNGRSYSYPLRYRVEVANPADFSDVRTVVDLTSDDQPAPPAGVPVEHRFGAVNARYVRLAALRLRPEADSTRYLALAELEVLSAGKNVARTARVTAPRSANSAGWSTAKLVDGITAPVDPPPVIQPVAELRRSFHIDAPVRRAVAYATAQGVYQLHINGRQVDDRVLAPEFTDYFKRIQYQTYDVTSLLRRGENVAAALVGAGWYAGRIGLFRRHMYGNQSRFLMRLEIELADGRRQAVITDETWRLHPAPPEVSADILDGAIYDARKELAGWDAPGFDAASWSPATADNTATGAELVAQPNEPIRPVLELRPVALTQVASGTWVFDLGQNMVDWCCLRLRGTPGKPVRIRYAEALREDGWIYTDNLRSAPQVDIYIPRGNGEEKFEPVFTYHGFRYVEVSGLSGRPQLADVTGVVAYSAAPDAGRFETSDSMFNRLMANIVWTQRANLYSTPTDCPQRDERLGWMGDIQTFAQTAMFNMDMGAFFTKWLRDVRDNQLPDGQFPDFAPNPNMGLGVNGFFSAPAWGDAGVIVPWRMYQNYGDRRIVAESFESACRWVNYIHKLNPDLLWRNGRNNDYGDWLNADTIIQENWPRKGGAIPKPIFATAFWAHSSQLVAKMATALGREQDAEHYNKLFEDIRDAFNRAWVKPDGSIESDTQAAYALALHFDLLPEDLRLAALTRMIAGSSRYGGHLSTGIHGTHRLMMELAREGRADEAYRLLQLRSFPSWGFMIENGASTIWERWDGYVKGRGFQDPGMNSLNHWALGAVGEWMWRNVVGLNPDDAPPGYERFTVRPRPGGSLTSASGTYESIRGTIRVVWTLQNGAFTLQVSIPPNSEATVHVPSEDSRTVESPGLSILKNEREGSVFRAGSGNYTFRSRL
jgi:alpha-L-rhamnosidase